MEDGGDVVGVAEGPRPNESREQSLDVVLVGLGAAELGGESSECRRGDRVVCFVIGEAGGSDGEFPAVVLGGGGQCLGGELAGARPGVLLGGDRLVGAEFGADVLEHSEQD